jgi:hypothetical protein
MPHNRSEVEDFVTSGNASCLNREAKEQIRRDADEIIRKNLRISAHAPVRVILDSDLTSIFRDYVNLIDSFQKFVTNKRHRTSLH